MEKKMESFEKWWEKASKDEMKYMHEDKEVCGYAWRAALKWALDYDDRCTSLRCVTAERIDEELDL